MAPQQTQTQARFAFLYLSRNMLHACLKRTTRLFQIITEVTTGIVTIAATAVFAEQSVGCFLMSTLLPFLPASPPNP